MGGCVAFLSARTEFYFLTYDRCCPTHPTWSRWHRPPNGTAVWMDRRCSCRVRSHVLGRPKSDIDRMHSLVGGDTRRERRRRGMIRSTTARFGPRDSRPKISLYMSLVQRRTRHESVSIVTVKLSAYRTDQMRITLSLLFLSPPSTEVRCPAQRLVQYTFPTKLHKRN